MSQETTVGPLQGALDSTSASNDADLLEKRKDGRPKGKKLKDPNAPKRHLSGYLRFLNERQKDNLSLPPLTRKELMLMREWSELPLRDKQKYLDAAKLDKNRYKREMEAYQKTELYTQFRQQQEKMAKCDDDGGDVDVEETDASGDDDDEDDKTIDDDKEDEEEDEELNLKFSKVSLDLENEEISNSDVAAEEKEEVEKEDADDTTKQTTSTTAGEPKKPRVSSPEKRKKTLVSSLKSDTADPYAWLQEIPERIRHRCLTDRDMSRLAQGVGSNWEFTAIELGLSKVEVDHCKMENPTTGLQMNCALHKWRNSRPEEAHLAGWIQALKTVVPLQLTLTR